MRVSHPALTLVLAALSLESVACSFLNKEEEDPAGTGGATNSGGSLGTGGAEASSGGNLGTGGQVGTGAGPGSGGAGLGTGGSLGSGGDGSGGGSSGSGGSSTTEGPVEDSGLDCEVSSPTGSNGGDDSTLPDPFTKWDGTQVTSMAEWRCRRRELVVEIEDKILGSKAPPPHTIGGTVDGSVSESSYTVEVDNPGGSMSFEGDIDLPSSGEAPYPAVIYLTMPGFGGHSLSDGVLNEEGVATMSYDVTQVSSEAARNFTSGGYFDANPDYEGNTGALVAWAWGVSRIIDMLEKHSDLIDPTKIAVHGCSRLGKGAFVVGAFDQRIALGLPFEPGTGGPAPLRALPVLGGQTLSGANGEASWFGPMADNYSSSMAVDMSDVAVMYAPRGLLVFDNAHIDHLAYKANFLGVAAARKLFEGMGAADAAWYLGDSGNSGHCNKRADEYGEPLRAMIKKFLKGDATATTGGLDAHANHGNINVDGWTDSWVTGTIAP